MNKHVILKLISGETLMAELTLATTHSVIVKRPVQVRLVPTIKNGEVAEEPVISIYCQFTYEEEFEFKNDMVVYCKPLIEKIAPFYEKTASGLYDVTVVSASVKEYDQGLEPLIDEEAFTVEDLIKSKIVH